MLGPENEDVPEGAAESDVDKVVNDVEKAGRALPQEEREAYRDAQRSVMDARRNAESHEGFLRIN